MKHRPTSIAAGGAPGFFIRVTLLSLALLAVVYLPGLSDAIHGDDFGHVSKASRMDLRHTFDFWELDREDVKGVWHIYGRIHGAFPEGTRAMRVYWRPWQNLLNLTDFLVWGKQFSGWKLTDYLLNAMAAGFLALILAHLGAGRLWAVILAMFWLFHPSRQLSVIWISARADAGAALGVAAACYWYLRYHNHGALPDRKYLAASLFAFFIALGFKEAACPFALVVAVHAWFVRPDLALATRLWACLRHSSPWLAVAGAYALFRFGVPLAPGVVAFDGANTHLLLNFNLFGVINNLLVYFVNVFFYYPMFDAQAVAQTPIGVSLSMLCLGAAGLLAFAMGRLSPHARTGLAAFALMLAPVMGIEQRPYFMTVPLLFMVVALMPAVKTLLAVTTSRAGRGLLGFLLAMWLLATVQTGAMLVKSEMTVPTLQSWSTLQVQAALPDLNDDDRVYFLNLWQSLDVSYAFTVPYLPKRPSFMVLSYNPALLPPRIVEQSMGLLPQPNRFLPKATLGITVVDDHTLDLKLANGHFMDVPAARMWLPEWLHSPSLFSRYQGYGFTVLVMEQDATGYPVHLRFAFDHPLCDPRAHYLLADGLILKPMDFCLATGQDAPGDAAAGPEMFPETAKPPR